METENHIKQTKDTLNSYMFYVKWERVKHVRKIIFARV